MDPELTQITDALRNVESDLFDLRADQERMDDRKRKLELRREILTAQIDLKKRLAFDRAAIRTKPKG